MEQRESSSSDGNGDGGSLQRILQALARQAPVTRATVQQGEPGPSRPTEQAHAVERSSVFQIPASQDVFGASQEDSLSALFSVPTLSPTPSATVPPHTVESSVSSVSSDGSIRVPTTSTSFVTSTLTCMSSSSRMPSSLESSFRIPATTSALIPFYRQEPPPLMSPDLGVLVPTTSDLVTPIFGSSSSPSHTPSSPEYAVYIPTTSPLVLPACESSSSSPALQGMPSVYESSSSSPASRGVPSVYEPSSSSPASRGVPSVYEPSLSSPASRGVPTTSTTATPFYESSSPPRTTTPILLIRQGPSPRSSPSDQRFVVPSYDEPSFSGSQLLPAGFVESVLSQLRRDQDEGGTSQQQQQQQPGPRVHLERLMPAFGQGSIERAQPHEGRGLGESPPRLERVQRVPPSGESSLSEDELNVLRARQGRAGDELSSPQAVPAVPVGLPGRVLQLSDQDVPGTESASSSSDACVVPGSGVGSRKRLQEGVVPSMSSRRLRVLKHLEALRTRGKGRSWSVLGQCSSVEEERPAEGAGEERPEEGTGEEQSVGEEPSAHAEQGREGGPGVPPLYTHDSSPTSVTEAASPSASPALSQASVATTASEVSNIHHRRLPLRLTALIAGGGGDSTDTSSGEYPSSLSEYSMSTQSLSFTVSSSSGSSSNSTLLSVEASSSSIHQLAAFSADENVKVAKSSQPYPESSGLVEKTSAHRWSYYTIIRNRG
ncbi:hypothetical protein EMCRGX_G021484 [Ephydatia muelleri]